MRARSGITKRINAKGVTCQSFAIYSKIAEVDALLQGSSARRKRVFEVHPEVCFWAWNDEQPMPHRKKSADGKTDRHDLIMETFHTEGSRVLSEVRAEKLKSEVADDDLHDSQISLSLDS